jgi:hypothetical protein
MNSQKVVSISYDLTAYLTIPVAELTAAVVAILDRGIRVDGDLLVVGSYLDAVTQGELDADATHSRANLAAMQYMANIIAEEFGEGPRSSALVTKSWALGDLRGLILSVAALSPNISASAIVASLEPILGHPLK